MTGRLHEHIVCCHIYLSLHDISVRLSKSDFHCAVKMSRQKKIVHANVLERPRNTNKMLENQLNQVKIGNFYSFAFKSQNFAQVVEKFVQTCVCVSSVFMLLFHNIDLLLVQRIKFLQFCIQKPEFCAGCGKFCADCQ